MSRSSYPYKSRRRGHRRGARPAPSLSGQLIRLHADQQDHLQRRFPPEDCLDLRRITPIGARPGALSKGGGCQRPERPRGAKRIALATKDIQAKGASCFFYNVQNEYGQHQSCREGARDIGRSGADFLPCVKANVADMSLVLKKRRGLAFLARNSLKTSGFLISP